MAGFASILMGGAQVPNAYDPLLTPEANALAGRTPPAAASQVMPQQRATFQKPKGVRNTVGTIADILTVLGGGEPMYAASLRQQERDFQAQQEEELGREKESAFANFLLNPNDPEATKRFATIAPVEYFKAVTELTPKPQNPGSVSDFQYTVRALQDQGLSPQEALAQARDMVRGAPAPVLRSVPGVGLVDASDPRNPNVVMAAPPAASGGAPEMSAFERRAEAIRQRLGDQAYAEFLATGKVTTASASPAKGGALGSTIQDIRSLYEQLNREGGMVSPKAGVVANLRARAANSDVGQLVSGALGTEAQTIRDQLASALPALMQQVKQATGMTAAQVNSIPEMRLLQDQVTNPTRSFEAVSATLDAIERRYLGGGGRPAAAPAPAASGGFKVVGKRKPQ
jgi:hypothetical protein